jgi:hypothetical protein
MQILSRRKLIRRLGVAGAACVAGCSHNSTLDLMRASFFGPSTGTAGYPATPEQIADLPYATLGVKIGDGPAAVMVLAQQQGGELVWASQDRVVFVTRGGRLIQTIGLTRDLARTDIVGNDPLSKISDQTVSLSSTPLTELVDLHSPDELSVPVRATLSILGTETIEIMGRPRATVHVLEALSVDKWTWTANNHYWVDIHNHRVWRSVVQFCPQVPPIRLELLKPAAAI